MLGLNFFDRGESSSGSMGEGIFSGRIYPGVGSWRISSPWPSWLCSLRQHRPHIRPGLECQSKYLIIWLLINTSFHSPCIHIEKKKKMKIKRVACLCHVHTTYLDIKEQWTCHLEHRPHHPAVGESHPLSLPTTCCERAVGLHVPCCRVHDKKKFRLTQSRSDIFWK